MPRRFSLLAGAVCTLLCAAAVQARPDSPVTIRGAILEATEQGPVSQGTLRLIIVNGGDQNVTGLKLRLLSPGSGSLGSGQGVDVGNVDMDATVIATTEFRFEKPFWDSDHPLVVEASYKQQRDGNEVKATLIVARDRGGQ
jgi:hypothetical protein